ncbi:FIVAR domain-containing protein [Bacillus sp. B-jedd]|uniref:FIVAR domain-containing protein n=1 Tax=Bacillus sp. B-jedd TaxID=1476857 RepID=UPI0009E2C817
MGVADKKEEVDYTSDSWIPFSKALTEAKTVLENHEATQEEVDRAVSALEEAVSGLIKVSEKGVIQPPDPVI